MNLLNYLSISHRSSGKLSKTAIARLALTTVIGVVLCLLATVSVSDTETFSSSAWVLPTATIALAVVLVVTQLGSFGKKSEGEKH